MNLRNAGLTVVALAVIAPNLAGQAHRWTIGLDIARAEVRGTSRDTSSADEPAFRPHDPTVVSLRATRSLGPVTIGLTGARGRAHLGLNGPALLVVDKAVTFTFYEIVPTVGVALATIGSTGQLVVEGGPLIGFWKVTDQSSRTRVGAQLGLALPIWLDRHLGGTVRVDGSVTSSVFEDGDLPTDFEQRSTWRIQVSMGVVTGW